ncbi:MAG: bifunctional folylpolyglutamate synthase/dihydrofolate synthase [Actinobacteria bacterium]|nr:bifunctional folylpolyglutamate synthase/dihydrofolate synthase [Actinomycetota bacterium]
MDGQSRRLPMLADVLDERTHERFNEVQAELLSRWPENRIGPGVGRVAHLMDLLGEPQRSIPAIHVSGTNGKTSTVRMIESLLRAFGLRTGVFTSPHLHNITERIRLDGSPVDQQRFVEAYEDIAPLMTIVDEASLAEGGPRMTFFESMTGLAYAIFADAPVDVMVVEVGIGGTDDATNVIDAAVSVVTPIDFDHMHILGNTISEIAANKAGIIKPGGIAVLAAQAVDAATVLLARCADTAVPAVRDQMEFAVVERLVAVGGQQLTIQGLFGEYDELFLPLIGAHQAHNAALALAAVEAFLGGGVTSERGRLDIDGVREGFASVTSPGRLEIVRRDPTVIVDAAHNPHGMRALAAGLAEAFSFGYLIGVFASLGDKDTDGMFAAVAGTFDEVIITRNESARASEPAVLAAVAQSHFEPEVVTTAPDLVAALERAVARADAVVEQIGAAAGIVVTGSVVTAAQARQMLGKAKV